MYASYFASRTRKELVLHSTPSLSDSKGATRIVSGKAEAKRIAKEHNATPWNF